MKTINEILTEEELNTLKQKGYVPIEVIGEGNTRYVIEVLYKNGDFQEKRVIKIPKNGNEIDDNSVCTLINLSKGDPNKKELVCASDIGYHPNIVKVIDNTRLNGKIVNVEEYLSGRSLEELVKCNGPFVKKGQMHAKESFEKIFKGVIQGMHYLNESKRKLHRDIKPSNILVTYDNEAKLTDLQNAISIDSLDYESLPTRGGTVCTHPKLLNAVVNGNRTHADKKTELYAFGATLYYALTGEYPFKYNIVRDENGTEISLGKETIKIALRNNGNAIKEITKEEHEKELKEALKKVPWQYRKLLKRCLGFDNEDRGYTLFSLDNDFKKACKSKRQKIIEQLKKKSPWVSAIAFLAFIGGYGIGLGINSAYNVTSPTLQQLLLDREKFDSSIKKFNINEENVKQYLKTEIDYVKKELQNPYNKKKIKEIQEEMHFIAKRSQSVDERLINALILSCAFEDEEARERLAKIKKRLKSTLVPNSFVLNCMDPYRRTDEKHLEQVVNETEKRLWAVKYLMQNYSFGDDVADVFAKYFCSREEIAIAMQKTGNYSYFPKIDTSTSPIGMKLHTVRKGYGEALPITERKLINRALALYFSMDKNGKFITTDSTLATLASPSKD